MFYRWNNWETWEQKGNSTRLFSWSFFSNHHSKLFFGRIKPCFLLPFEAEPYILSAICVPIPQKGPIVLMVSPWELNETHIKFQRIPSQVFAGGCHSLPLNLSTRFRLHLAQKMMPAFMALFNSSGKQRLHQDEIHCSWCIAKGRLNTVQRVLSAISTPVLEHYKSVTAL